MIIQLSAFTLMIYDFQAANTGKECDQFVIIYGTRGFF